MIGTSVPTIGKLGRPVMGRPFFFVRVPINPAN